MKCLKQRQKLRCTASNGINVQTGGSIKICTSPCHNDYKQKNEVIIRGFDNHLFPLIKALHFDVFKSVCF